MDRCFWCWLKGQARIPVPPVCSIEWTQAEWETWSRPALAAPVRLECAGLFWYATRERNEKGVTLYRTMEAK